MPDKKAKILIIKDDKFLLKLYTDKLKRENFEVVSSLTGEEGLTKVFTEKPDLIILDLVLPRKNGFDVLCEIRLDPITKEIPVIILTNLGQDSDIKMGLDLGASAYLVKTDFSINELPAVVREHLIKSQR